ncbi:MAG TPA: hypothetical protein VGT04_01010, partial [Acidobacteriaceae bacterium]|nr:hypothetical protein [Acidobacteriaceae bacterium]
LLLRTRSCMQTERKNCSGSGEQDQHRESVMSGVQQSQREQPGFRVGCGPVFSPAAPALNAVAPPVY